MRVCKSTRSISDVEVITFKLCHFEVKHITKGLNSHENFVSHFVEFAVYIASNIYDLGVLGPSHSLPEGRVRECSIFHNTMKLESMHRQNRSTLFVQSAPVACCSNNIERMKDQVLFTGC